MNKDYIWEVGEYIACGHKISEAATKFSKSTSSIKKYLAKIRDKDSEFYNEILAEKIRLAQLKIELQGHIKGGSNGKRGRNLSEEQIKLYLEAFISSGLTLEGFADLSQIPKSTLYDNFCSITDPELRNKFREYMTRYQPSTVSDKGYELGCNTWKR